MPRQYRKTVPEPKMINLSIPGTMHADLQHLADQETERRLSPTPMTAIIRMLLAQGILQAKKNGGLK